MNDEYRVDKNFERIKRSENNIILFGDVGSGKTTIINKICGVNFLIKDSGFSCTQDAQFASTSDNSLIIDFPGLCATDETIRHLKIQKTALSVIPVRIICFIIKYDRYDFILKKAVQMLKIFYEHKDNICIIITFSENIDMIKKSEIELIFKKKIKIENKNVIFSSKNTTSFELVNKLNVIKNSVSNISSIKFSERDLINTVGNEGITLEIREEREKYIEKYKKALELFKNEFIKATDYSRKFELYYSFMDYKDNLVDSFSDMIKKTIVDTDSSIVEFITFNNELYMPFNEMAERLEKEMKIEKSDFNARTDPRIWSMIYNNKYFYIFKYFD